MNGKTAQKLVKARLAWGYPEQAAHLLTLAASEGYRYGGHAACLDEGGGAIYVSPRGTYLDDWLFWLDPAPAGSLFHAWRLPRRRGRDLIGELNKVAEHENANGFSLVALVPLDAFADETTGPGTVGYFALFERPAGRDCPLMLDRWTLRPERVATEEGVPCPVIGCDFVAPRMTGAGPNLGSSKDGLSDYLCPRHRIYISPTTFEYEEPATSLLWPGDKETAQRLAGAGKRTWARMGRERDEDSLTWNVFRYLERHGLLEKLLGGLLRRAAPALPRLGPVEKVVYWSVDLDKKATWEDLQRARNRIGEGARGSEPDVVVVFRRAVALVEVKLDSASVTPAPSPLPPYYRDDHGVFKKDLQSAASAEGIGYELMRFFLLGEALREHLNKPLAVISLTQDGLDDDLPQRVGKAVHLNAARCYGRLSWREVYEFIEQSDVDNPVERMIMVRYLRGKTLGYDAAGTLRTLLP